MNNSKIQELTEYVYDIFKNHKPPYNNFLTNDIISLQLGEKLGVFIPDENITISVVNNLLETKKLKTVVYNTDELDEMGDGYLTATYENQGLNSYQEWAYVLSSEVVE